MNIKALASIGVVVALLTAWLLSSLYSASNVQIKEVSSSAKAERSVPASMDAIGEGQSQGVTTSVNVANQDVKTTVRVAE